MANRDDVPARDVPARDVPARNVLAIDRLIHEPARLVILAVLSKVEWADFNFLLNATGLSKGNLSRQATKLEEAGYIRIEKYFKGKIPATRYEMTTTGRDALTAYWRQMGKLQSAIESSSD